MQIIPTILEKNFEIAEEKILMVKDLAKLIQVDVIDGNFSAGKTFELELINKIKETENILWEVHLMVKEPKNWIEKCNFVGASRIIGQVEMMSDKNHFIKKVKDMGIDAGLAFDIDTEIEDISDDTDIVLLMARKTGFGYQEINKKIWEKIEKLKILKEKNNLKLEIGVDGGINENNIKDFKNAGVEIAYCGSAIFNGNVKDNLEKLNYAIENK